ncbi:hypothetical protein [Pararhodonellum marinum]|uniref:hypothetical protein n=1 Tax=Pararhodonellum marinum TaxID=2755358 RepID=UPI00188F3926|nr:hypothetical protein [Pararhodonellum marinum]
MSSLSSYPSSSERIFSFQKVSRKTSENPQPVVLDYLLESAQVTVIENTAFDFPNFPESNKIFKVIYFELSDASKELKGLFRGLFSLGKPKGVILEEIKEKDQFVVKYYESDAQVVRTYLSGIFSLVEGEQRFKSLLKKIIINQEKFRNEEALLQKELLAS